jgi:hypothetical protein
VQQHIGIRFTGVFIGPTVYIQDFDAATIHQRHI